MNNILIDKCPCCGGIAIIKDDDSSLQSYYGFPSNYVQCQECGLRTGCGTIEDVVAKWNRRVYEYKNI